MKLFLDDVRRPIDCMAYMEYNIGYEESLIYTKDWSIVRNYDDFVAAVQDNIDSITHVSFDHDLSPEHYNRSMYSMDHTEYNKLYDQFLTKTGYHCALWMKEYYTTMGKELPNILIHTMNPVGYQNISKTLYKL